MRLHESVMKRMRRGWTLLPALVLPVLAGCGELTSGGAGEVDAVFTADDPQQAQSASPMSAESGPDVGTAASRSVAAGGSTALTEGELFVTAEVFLRSDASGQWTAITDSPAALTLDLQGTTERSAGSAELTAGSYSRVRIVFHRVEAQVTAGLVIGGVTVTGTVRVDLGADGQHSVEKDIALKVEADASADVLVDMNSDVWLLTAQGATLRTVTEAALEAAVRVRAR